MLDTARRVLGYEMRIAEWIGLAVLLALPYLGIGIIWALTHSGPVLGSVLAWPLLLLLYTFCGS
ncbi:hypothetical protein [Mycolicibacterium bacteremicum]|uniref:Uncharacterized protein n=1 Tax=Mycolicibacterium bacteremicum TaxID=564198 RepID=A0A1W9YQA2_MYCBA|nr:hypothetical protein [Mycolicibacterium bacteremicum]ORA01970.1 hypothetical protein BST17_25790 [Mycolicibacterium bacteremicum]